MGDRTGLGPLELALLRSVEAARTQPEGPVATPAVLRHLDDIEHFGPTYGVQALQHLGTWWNVHVRLFDLHGNWGSVYGDEMADAVYTKVAVSAAGEVALAAERREVGPVPVGIINGSVYRGGLVPPLDPARTLDLLTRLVRGEQPAEPITAGLVRLPSGGTVAGDLPALLDGRTARIVTSCRIEREGTQEMPVLVVTGVPAGVSVELVHQCLMTRMRRPRRPDRPGRHYLAEPRQEYVGTSEPVTDVTDRSTRSAPIRIEVRLDPGLDVDAAEQQVRSYWPVTVETDWQVPGGLEAMLRGWASGCAGDVSGIEALRDVLT